MIRSKLIALSLFATLLAVPSPGAARTWDVTGDGKALREAIRSAADGDTVRVGPGEYDFEPLVRKEIGFSLIGSDGAESTTIRGTVDTMAILTVYAAGRPVHIEGITFDRNTPGTTYALVTGSTLLDLEGCRFLGGSGVLADSTKGTVRGNVFDCCFNGMKILNSPLVIEKNSFDRTRQYAITLRGSSAEIYNNLFNRTMTASILIVGKRRYPVVGGSPGKGNIFLSHTGYILFNSSRNEINARYNYWGIATTSVMNRLGYPANIDKIFDKWDGEDRANGMVDYSEWLKERPDEAPAAPAADGTRGKKIPSGVLLSGLLVLAALLVFALRLRR